MRWLVGGMFVINCKPNNNMIWENTSIYKKIICVICLMVCHQMDLSLVDCINSHHQGGSVVHFDGMIVIGPHNLSNICVFCVIMRNK